MSVETGDALSVAALATGVAGATVTASDSTSADDRYVVVVVSCPGSLARAREATLTMSVESVKSVDDREVSDLFD